MKLTAFLSVLALFAAAVNAATIHVPADQPTIQAGIDPANNGNVVMSVNDTYARPNIFSLCSKNPYLGNNCDAVRFSAHLAARGPESESKWRNSHE